MLFSYPLISAIKDKSMDIFLLFLLFYIGCIIGMCILILFDKANPMRYKHVFVTKGYVHNVIYNHGKNMAIIYYDFENGIYRNGVCKGEFLEKNKNDVMPGMYINVLVAEKPSGIRLICIKPDTI